jgi:predicted O-linked N-acetylglucosamine transferase (SPINDLY family)
MPDSYQVNNYEADPVASSIPCHTELGIGRFIFASFCKAYKIEREVFEAWMRILKRVPATELWLMPESSRVKQNFCRVADSMDVDSSRILFMDKIEKKAHFHRLSRVGLALDTRTVNGAATTSDALWARVPVLTIQGRHFASRMSSSLLNTIGLPELVTHNLDEYIDLAVKMATDPALLKATKSRLDSQCRSGVLFNTSQFVNRLESGYQLMWDRHVEGHPTGPIVVNRINNENRRKTPSPLFS